jgi:uncharacterized phiE125 gp8 family phage protein
VDAIAAGGKHLHRSHEVMNVELIEAPPFLPVTLAEVYLHLRLDPEGSPPTHPDDSMLLMHLGTATKQAEKYIRGSVIRRRLRLHVPRFPCFGEGLVLLRGPVLSVESVQYYDAANELQTLDASSWYVSDDARKQLRLASGVAGPATYCRPDAVRVDYTAGYAPEGSPPATQSEYAANVPDSIKAAILIGVELLYDSMLPQQRDAMEKARACVLEDFKQYLTP